MKTPVLLSLVGGLALAAPALHAQETGRVISREALIEQVAVPRQVCNSNPVVVQSGPSGAGAALGAIAGGAAGNAIGAGSGRAAATAIGIIGGALLGNQVEGGNPQVQQQTVCSTQTTYENRTVGYRVTYEYGGRQYTTELAQDPGPTIALDVVPAGSVRSASSAGPAPLATAPALGVPVATIIREVTAPTVVTYPAYPDYSGYSGYAGYPGYYYAPAPVFRPYYPSYSAYPYYYGPRVSLGIGIGVGGGHRHHWH